MRTFKIDDEIDFIHKVRNIYLKKRNYEVATKIQAFCRGCLTRGWYREFYKDKVGKVIKI